MERKLVKRMMVAEENMEYPALLPFQPSNIIYYIPGFVAPRTLPVILCKYGTKVDAMCFTN